MHACFSLSLFSLSFCVMWMYRNHSLAQCHIIFIYGIKYWDSAMINILNKFATMHTHKWHLLLFTRFSTHPTIYVFVHPYCSLIFTQFGWQFIESTKIGNAFYSALNLLHSAFYFFRLFLIVFSPKYEKQRHKSWNNFNLYLHSKKIE